MVVGVVPGRIGGKTPCRPVLKSLVHGQYDEAPGTTQPPMVQQSGQVRAGAGRVALVPAQDLGDAVFHLLLLLRGVLVARAAHPSHPAPWGQRRRSVSGAGQGTDRLVIWLPFSSPPRRDGRLKCSRRFHAI